MDKQIFPNFREIHTIIFDFDGVFTNNKVYISEEGVESIRCDRSDGLAFDILRSFKEKYQWDLSYFILSKEKNNVVEKRSKKLKVPCYFGVDDKLLFLKNYLQKKDKNDTSGIMYLGNDLNDLRVMRYVGWSVAPADAHPIVKTESKITLPKSGGAGFVRFFVEELIGLNKNMDLIDELCI